MKMLSIDLETYSSEDITKTGVYRYASADDFEILLFGYAGIVLGIIILIVIVVAIFNNNGN